MLRRFRAVVAAVVIAGLISAGPLAASNVGPNPPGVLYYADGSVHWFIYVSLTPEFVTASDDAHTTDLDPTDLSTPTSSTHNGADVAVYDQDDGDAGYYGYYDCVTEVAGDSTRCDHAHVVFNLWASLNWDSTKRKSTACHEFGHSVGLQHVYSTWTCMRGDEVFPLDYMQHDVDHINGKY